MKTSAKLTTAIIASLILVMAGSTHISKWGQSAKEASHSEIIPGLTIEADSNWSYSGFQKAVFTSLSVQIDSNYDVAKPDELMNYLLLTAWSVNDIKPNRLVAIHFKDSLTFDPASAARSAGWSQIESFPPGKAPGVYISPNEVENKVGFWPGSIPIPPTGMLVVK